MFDLATDGYTIPLAAALALLWVWSIRLSSRGDRFGWMGVIGSLFGFVWIGFGLDFVLRFWVLKWDVETYTVTNVPIWEFPANTIDKALMLAGLFWAALCMGYAVGVRRHGLGPFRMFRSIDTWHRTAINTLALLSLSCTIIAGFNYLLVPIPMWSALITPLGLISALWPIPAAIEWADYFEAQRFRLSAGAWRWLYIIPGVVYVIVMPYRERMLQLLLVPIVAALGAKKRVAPIPLVAGLVITLFVSTATMTAWRKMLWGETNISSATTYSLDPETWEPGGPEAPWVGLLRRIHSFDSLVLTIEYVPTQVPFDNRNILTNSLLAMVPRLIFPEKQLRSRAEEFSVVIWQYPAQYTAVPSKIAPSMPGELYWSGGVWYILAGASLWGLIIGAYEGWKDNLPPLAARVLQSFLFMFFFLSTERDFVFNVSATAQGTLALLIITAALTRVPWLEKFRRP